MASQSDISFKTCNFCKPIHSTEAQRTLFTTRHSRVILVNDQLWLGRCIVVPKRHVSSFEQLHPMELQDLHECRVKVSRVYDRLFGITHDWMENSNPEGDHADVISMHHMQCDFFPYQRPGNITGRKFSVMQDKLTDIASISKPEYESAFQVQLANFKNDVQAELISQRLISEENLRDANPSRDIISLCAKYRESHSFDECTTPALITTAVVVIDFARRITSRL